MTAKVLVDLSEHTNQEKLCRCRLPAGSALRAGGFVLPATRQPVQPLRWRESQVRS